MKKVVIIAERGVQDEEYIYPYYRLQEESDIEVSVATLTGEVAHGKYGIPIRATMDVTSLDANNFSGVIIPGGLESPERLRQNHHVLKFLQDMNSSGKAIGAICHGPWVLISAQLCSNRPLTCYIGMKDDLINAGGIYVPSSDVVISSNIITSPHYRHNAKFVSTFIKKLRSSSSASYRDKVVNKPWGHEFLVAEESAVGIWYLHINPLCCTSLHSHPHKRTTLIVLHGTASLSFLAGSPSILTTGNIAHIPAGTFHKTTNPCSSDYLGLLELESPNDKLDIIRLSDDYGRSGTPYEGSAYYSPQTPPLDLCIGYKLGNYFIKYGVGGDLGITAEGEVVSGEDNCIIRMVRHGS